MRCMCVVFALCYVVLLHMWYVVCMYGYVQCVYFVCVIWLYCVCCVVCVFDMCGVVCVCGVVHVCCTCGISMGSVCV